MKRIAITSFFVIAAAAAVALAQPHHPPMPGPEGMHAHLVKAEQYLGLSADQKAAWEAAFNDFLSKQQSLMTADRDAHNALREALESSSPDPCTVGNLAIRAHAGMAQMKAAHDALHAKLASSLTADQKAKFDAYVAAAMAGHDGPPPMHP